MHMHSSRCAGIISQMHHSTSNSPDKHNIIIHGQANLSAVISIDLYQTLIFLTWFICPERAEHVEAANILKLFHPVVDAVDSQGHESSHSEHQDVNSNSMQQVERRWPQSHHWCCPWEHTAEAEGACAD